MGGGLYGLMGGGADRPLSLIAPKHGLMGRIRPKPMGRWADGPLGRVLGRGPGRSPGPSRSPGQPRLRTK
ncbi:hypothetical protein JOF35_001755 [Streptomyces demainii]|uniref:Uncharacterized protein n=1 Tax=Streptomyces demainii TaxID=588122 RepID=A0ABT9KM04_9ACTN|nr:hypothetical protein [Streptomyces demainii]